MFGKFDKPAFHENLEVLPDFASAAPPSFILRNLIPSRYHVSVKWSVPAICKPAMRPSGANAFNSNSLVIPWPTMQLDGSNQFSHSRSPDTERIASAQAHSTNNFGPDRVERTRLCSGIRRPHRESAARRSSCT
eukprot:684524-Prymnesium_polylepis.1